MDAEQHPGCGGMAPSAEILAEGGQAPPLPPKTPPSPGVGSLQSVTSMSTAIELLPYHPFAPLRKETFLGLLTQITVPFFIAGVGTIGAGVLLGSVEEWEVFLKIPSLYILVPALTGLKGNLDTCLASRMCTQANLGNLHTMRDIWANFSSNMALVQVQSIVASLIAGIFAVVAGYVENGTADYKHALLLSAAGVTTATSACFFLDTLFMTMIVVSHRFKINPDNVVALMVGSFGDLVSLSIFSNLASAMYKVEDTYWWTFLIIIGFYLFMLPWWIMLARRNKITRLVLTQGWLPVLSALFISGTSGIVMDAVVDQYTGFTTFSPIVSGIGGNSASVQASRTATLLHATSVLGVLNETSKMCVSPIAALFYGSPSAKSARILIAITIPGQALFAFIADFIHNGRSTITPIFIAAYLAAVLVQTMIMLYLTHILSHFMWKRKQDPDNATIPYLTAIADLLGSLLLAGAFAFLVWNGTPYATS